jgi:hypothetical protein
LQKQLAIVLVALGVGSLAAGTAHARSYTIESGKYSVTKLEPLITKSTRTYAPTIRKAVHAFGKPSNKFPLSNSGCVVKWKRLGLRIVFANFGDTRSTCNPGVGRAQSFTIERSAKWRTWKGLRIGMAGASVLQLDPRSRWVDNSRFYRDGYWLRSAVSPFGDGSRYPTIAATLKARVVSSFYGWIGSAGE